MSELLIVGIDPGTITAYAIIDLKGKLLELNSAKHLSQASLINKLLKFGKTFLIGTDVTPTPKYIKKLATLIGAKTIEPDYNMQCIEKTKIVDKFLKKLAERIKIKNKHERDALIAALIGYKKIKPLIKKIDDHLASTGNLMLKKEIHEKVLIKKIPITKAIAQIKRSKTHS